MGSFVAGYLMLMTVAGFTNRGGVIVEMRRWKICTGEVRQGLRRGMGCGFCVLGCVGMGIVMKLK